MTISNSNGTNIALMPIASGAATLYHLRGFGPTHPNSTLYIFDSLGEPVTGQAPAVAMPIHDGEFDLDFGANGRPFTNGIWAMVQAGNSYATPGSTVNGFWDAQYA